MNKNEDLQQANADLTTKEKLILAGIHLFSKYGFAGTTTRMIAEAVDANNAVVFFHFKSKENLYAEVLNTVAQKSKTYFYPLQQEILEARNTKAFSSHDAWIYIEKYINLYIKLLQDNSRKEELYLLLHEELNPINGQRPITQVTCAETEQVFKQLLMDYWQNTDFKSAAIVSRLAISSLISLSEHPTFIRLTLELQEDDVLPESVWSSIKEFTLHSLKSYNPLHN